MAPNLAPSSIKDQVGFWGQPTSTLDWCEENYVVSHYIAEFWNTVSNFALIVPPLLAMIYLSKYRQVEMRYHVACAMTLLVGIGSCLFHMTLLYEAQLLDELPMIYGSCVYLYCIVEADGHKEKANTILAIALTIFAIAVTVAYLLMKEPLIHEIAYGLMLTLIIAKSAHIIVMKDRQHSRYLFFLSLFLILGAVGIWIGDNNLCVKLRETRDSLPFPITLLTHGHMWWHIMTGFGVYIHIMYSLHIRTSFLEYAPKIKHVASLPYISLPVTEEHVGSKKISYDKNKNHFQ